MNLFARFARYFAVGSSSPSESSCSADILCPARAIYCAFPVKGPPGVPLGSR